MRFPVGMGILRKSYRNGKDEIHIGILDGNGKQPGSKSLRERTACGCAKLKVNLVKDY